MSNYLPLMVREILSKTGWSENEIAAYSALLEKGAMGLKELSNETSISASTLQYVIKQLLLKKMLSKNYVNKKPVYFASDIIQLRKWVKGVSKQYETYKNTVDKFVDQYDFSPQMYTPKVRFYEGIKGVKQSYRTILEECNGMEMRTMFAIDESGKSELEDFFVGEFNLERAKKGIKSRCLAVDCNESRNYFKTEKAELRITKVIPRGFLLPNIDADITIFDNSIHYMSSNNNGVISMIIKDEGLSHILRTIFDSFWESAEKLTFRNGVDGVLESYNQVLEIMKELGVKETKSFYSIDLENRTEIEAFIQKKFIPSRVKEGILSKNIALNDPISRKYKKDSEVNLSKTRLVSSKTFPAVNIELMTFKDMLFFMSHDTKLQNAFSMLVKDNALVSTLGSLFNIMWSTAERCQFYEGADGIKQSYFDMIDECQAKEIVGFFSVIEEVRPDLQDFFIKEYVPLRVEKGISIKNIALKSPKTTYYKKNDAKDLRETRLVSNRQFPLLNTEFNLFDDKLHCMSFTEDEGFAMIVKDANLVSILKGVFGIAWDSLK